MTDKKVPTWLGKNRDESAKRIGTCTDDFGVERDVYETRPVISNGTKSVHVPREVSKSESYHKFWDHVPTSTIEKEIP